MIGPTINIRISAKEPMNYIERYKISEHKLNQQFIESEITTVSHQGYEAWVRQRVQRLADAGNEFLSQLAPRRTDITLIESDAFPTRLVSCLMERQKSSSSAGAIPAEAYLPNILRVTGLVMRSIPLLQVYSHKPPAIPSMR